jgi:hypothetical protein
VDGTTIVAVYGAIVATIVGAAQIYMQVTGSRARRRDEASAIVGRLSTLLFYVNPSTGLVGGIPRDRVQEAINDYSDQWQPLRAELEGLGVRHPKISVLVRTVIDAVQESINLSFWGARDADRPLSEREWEQLRIRYERALHGAEDLRQAVRRL